jgi:hypothetical protein
MTARDKLLTGHGRDLDDLCNIHGQLPQRSTIGFAERSIDEGT